RQGFMLPIEGAIYRLDTIGTLWAKLKKVAHDAIPEGVECQRDSYVVPYRSLVELHGQGNVVFTAMRPSAPGQPLRAEIRIAPNFKPIDDGLEFSKGIVVKVEPGGKLTIPGSGNKHEGNHTHVVRKIVPFDAEKKIS